MSIVGWNGLSSFENTIKQEENLHLKKYALALKENRAITSYF